MSSTAISAGNAGASGQALGRGFRSSFVPDATPIVFIVDEDASTRKALELLIRSEGWRCETFASASEFLKAPKTVVPCCLVLDVSLPGLSGLELQKRAANERPDMPVMFVTARGDVRTTVQAMKAGAVEFFTKPFPDELVVTAIREALERSRSALNREAEMRTVRDGYASLSPRERQVLQLLVSGLLNKQVGGELGITEHTVKVHRGRLMQKMQAGSFAQLVRMAAKIGVGSVERQRAVN